MERARDLFIKQNITHRLKNVWIKTNRKLADIARTSIRIKNLVQALCIAAVCVHDLTLFKFQVDPIEGDALINRRRIISNFAFDRILNRAREDLTIRYIVRATTSDRADALDRETQIRIWPLEMHLISIGHQRLQTLHPLHHT